MKQIYLTIHALFQASMAKSKIKTANNLTFCNQVLGRFKEKIDIRAYAITKQQVT